MFEEVLYSKTVEVIESLGPNLETFYLAGGTGLALQLGHRRSDDLDFFSGSLFNTDAILSLISPDKVLFTSTGTVHCEIKDIRISFFYYNVPLIYPALSWHGIKVANYKDIVAEKIKTISQRGAKKDFLDLYAVLKMKHSISEVCGFFKKRFAASGINFYHVIRSLVYFEDAESEPNPLILLPEKDWQWDDVKSFFINNISIFEHELGL